MQFKTVKTAADLPFGGVELVKVDSTITEVIIGKLRIRQGQYSGISVLVEAPFDTAKRFKIVATLEGFPTVTQYHEDDYSAERAADKLRDKGAEVIKSTVQALINESGEAVGEDNPDAPVRPLERVDDLIPF